MSVEDSFREMNSKQIQIDKIQSLLGGVREILRIRVVHILGIAGIAVISSVQPAHSQEYSADVSSSSTFDPRDFVSLGNIPYDLNTEEGMKSMYKDDGYTVPEDFSDMYQRFLKPYYDCLGEAFGEAENIDFGPADIADIISFYRNPDEENYNTVLHLYPNPSLSSKIREKMNAIFSNYMFENTEKGVSFILGKPQKKEVIPICSDGTVLGILPDINQDPELCYPVLIQNRAIGNKEVLI